jgi:hypothetical protein
MTIKISIRLSIYPRRPQLLTRAKMHTPWLNCPGVLQSDYGSEMQSRADGDAGYHLSPHIGGVGVRAPSKSTLNTAVCWSFYKESQPTTYCQGKWKSSSSLRRESWWNWLTLLFLPRGPSCSAHFPHHWAAVQVTICPSQPTVCTTSVTNFSPYLWDS